MPGTKRQHYVQRAYLERFTRNNVVYVRRRDGRAFPTGPVNVAVECGFYDIRTEDGSPSKVVEELLCDIEGMVMPVFASIDDLGSAPARGTPDREILSAYLAVQFTRTPEQRERVLFPERLARYLDGRELSRELVAEYLANVHLGFTPSAREVQGAFDFAAFALQEPETFTPELSISVMFRNVPLLAPVLDSFHWTVEHDRKARFMTSDSPLVIWRPPSVRDRYEGVGLENANEIRFPLDPAKQLVLTRRERPVSTRISGERVAQCNRDIAAGCHKFIVGNPRHEHVAAALPLKARRPVWRFDTGPLYKKAPDGATVYAGEVLHTWVPRR